MPAISKIRFTNIVYEDGNKRYNDETFQFDGHNGAILLENGGGKTVFIQTALQAVLPHTDLAGRKIKDTFSLENGPAHVAIEWIVHERPRRYAVTCLTLFLTSTGLDSIRYVYDYSANDPDKLDHIPFVRISDGKARSAEKGEMQDYYQGMVQKRVNAQTFSTIKAYQLYLEEQFHIISTEWEWIAKINQSEGGIEHFFDECRTTMQLFDKLLIPVVETAMSGYSEGEFAEAFQTHRDGFKKYKELKEKVEENTRILAELDKYVGSFSKLHAKQSEYAASQFEAKAYWIAAQQHAHEKAAELTRLQEQGIEWGGKQGRLAEKKDSLHIAKQQQGLSASEAKLQLAEEDKRRMEEQLRETERHYYSLRLAEYKQMRLKADETSRSVRAQLELLEQNREELELEAAWTSNGGQIRTLLDGLEARWTEEKRGHAEASDAVQSGMEAEAAALKSLSEQIRRLQDEVLKREVSAEEKERVRAETIRGIVANPTVDQIEELCPAWVKRHRELDERIVALGQLNKELAARKSEEQERYEAAQATIREESGHRSRLEEKQEQLQAAHKAILSVLAALRPGWERLQSVYDRQTSIERQLAEDVEKLSESREALLQRERLAFRFVDDYAGQERFFAEPFVEEQLKKWGNGFSCLQTGIAYLEDVDRLELLDDPARSLWSATLITTQEEKAALCSKLAAYADQLQYPVRVLSTNEAAGLVQGEAGGMDTVAAPIWIEPQHWRSNGSREAFAQWKKAVGLQAEQSRSDRLEQEQVLKHREEIVKDFARFVSRYPLESVQELEEKLARLRNTIRQLEQSAAQCKRSIEAAEMTIQENNRTISVHKDELNQLERWIEAGRKYIALGVEIDGLKKEIEELQEQARTLQSKWNSHQREYTRLEHINAEHRTAAQRLDDELRNLQRQELYAEVRDAMAIPTEHSLERLKLERGTLYLRRQHISRGRQELELQYANAVEKRESMDNEMSRLCSEHAALGPLEQLEFPFDGKDRMSLLLGQVQQRKASWVALTEAYSLEYNDYVAWKEKVKQLSDRYRKDHADRQPIVFHEALTAVADQILIEEKQLYAEKRELERLEGSVQLQLEELRAVTQELLPYKLQHGFENPVVRAAELTHEALTHFEYNRMSVIRQVIARLTALYEAVESEALQLRKARELFKAFCRRQIKDVKLREMAEQGVEQKTEYEDVAAFHQTMQNRIQRVNHIAEETMRTHNQQLEQYIVHVHSHLKQIASELREIPNKTRVKTESEWKAIYSFHVPEWDEQDGKGAIRGHLDWILEQLEKEKYKDDQGQELESTVRKDLERWLETKQLLQVVLQDKSMKVTCRKVTNENTVTKAAYSWEQSNNWSGGEKWSKNMTLFLGLLNYVAEKRQHIQAGMKRHRTVILDNPFGKASSDHVLSPVFFIAEQLGFQIIALTAHAEGKFLQDYFPVVFSCRLRQAASSSKQVMTKEKKIDHAYFRDHAPVSLERLGDVKQLELFSL
ncbi:chromosome segregation ATPase [Paenibacillus koleovorans]|uniref:chromosome segregation ATPase n=1 Tax=Paenibacillus koleovorans TaxID=121608 RepID=UPI000FDA1613|nr:chromosome segregation ATPase [Paenibacillus koleovorans]